MSSEARIIWLEQGREGYGTAAWPITEDQLQACEVTVPADTEARQGTYRRLPDDQEAFVNALEQVQLPVFLHSDWMAYQKTYKTVDHTDADNEVAAIEGLRQKLEDAASAIVANGHTSISPIVTRKFSTGASSWYVDANVILVRPST